MNKSNKILLFSTNTWFLNKKIYTFVILFYKLFLYYYGN